MTFDEVLAQIVELLQREGRVTYRALKRRFALDDDYLEDLKGEIIKAKRLAVDEAGEVLVWVGASGASSSQLSAPRTSDSGLRTPDSKSQSLDARPTEGERRQLTVEFIDLVGSTTLSQQLDPEDYHNRVVAYQAACRQVIVRYQGHIAQYLGDGVLAYFGYPAAHEDDAARAVRSGLEVVAAVGRLEFTPPLQVRIGIHTGPVVVGEIGAGEHTERLALGETPNIAARVQGVAEPNTVVISQATSRLVQGFFTCEATGPRSLKNVAAPIELYRVHGEGEAHTRFEVSVQKGLTPLVGRESELRILRQHWEQAKAGAGQVVLLSGEPGIGKSRLVQVLKERLRGEEQARVECRCSPFYQNSALYPVTEHLQRLLEWRKEESSEEKLSKLEQTLRQYGFDLKDTVPLFAALLSLPHPAGYPSLNLTPQLQKQQTLEALVTWLLKEAAHQPVRLDMEDLHWADPSTLEFLTLLIDQVPTTRLLLLLTFRPEFRPPWAMRSYLIQVTLNRLPPDQVGEMVGKVTRGKALPAEVVQQVIAKTDGVPLFVEELTKTVVEAVETQHAASLQSLAIPVTLHDVLMARLDRLNTAKEIAQLGATLGREFSYELIRAVSPCNEETLQKSLSQLVETELVYQRGLPPQAKYLFKHALIQDAAYQSLLKSKRQQLHRQIAQVLEEQPSDARETQPEFLAHHYTEAGLIEQAIPYWQRAGQKAVEHSANVEAIGHLTKGLELLKALPETPHHAQQELMLQIALGAPLIAAKGYAAPEVKKTYNRALELCQQHGETPYLATVLRGLWVYHVVAGDLETARNLGEQLLTLAQDAQDSALLLEAHHALGQTLFLLGDFIAAREHCEQGSALYDPRAHHSHVFIYGTDPGVACLFWGALAVWFLGYPDQALERSLKAHTLAQQLAHPLDLAYGSQAVASVHQYRREGQSARTRAEATMGNSVAQGLPFWLAFGTFVYGWALADLGQEEIGIAHMHQGMSAWHATGAKIWQVYYLVPLVEAYGRRNQPEEGLALSTRALAAIDEIGERTHEAELYRLRGELTLQQLSVTNPQPPTPNIQDTEACFHKAIEVARKQHAKSLELRAVMSLARLWQRQGKKAEARQRLAEIYGWFTEGFDTKDLQEAKALLGELS